MFEDIYKGERELKFNKYMYLRLYFYYWCILNFLVIGKEIFIVN